MMVIQGRYFFFICCLFVAHLARCVSGLTEFSKSFNGSDVITSFQGVTIKACARQCEARPNCKSAVYYRRAEYCKLTSYDRDVESVVSTAGTTLLSGFNAPVQPIPDCDGTECSANETCAKQSSGNRVCEIKECDKPVADQAEFLGNQYSVGSKQVDICSYRDVQVTCDQSGQWVPSENLVVRDCNDVCGTSGIYTASGLQVYCDMDTDEGHWLVFQRRQDGSETFERNWSDYRDGFGSLQGEFWLGNDLIRQILNNGEYELRIDLHDWSNNTRFAKYSSFSIDDESDNYRLFVSGYSGDSGNSFTYMNGYMFSTIDRDNDVHDSGSCAVLYRGGWWYTACHGSNLNGLYHVGGNTTVYAKTVVWNSWLGYLYSLKFTEMKIRRK